VTAGADRDLVVTLRGTTVSVTLNGAPVTGFVFNAVVVDGGFGIITRGGSSSFDSVTFKTDDPVFITPGGSLMAASAPTTTAPADGYVTAAQLKPFVDAAVARWTAALGGIDVASVARKLSFEVVDLPGLVLGQSVGRVILIDTNAAGFGWFVDASPTDDKEFAGKNGAGELKAQAGSAALGRMDLLTVVMHELGHALGFDHSAGTSAPDVMTETLVTGVRRLPVVDSRGTATTTQTEGSTTSGSTTTSSTSTTTTTTTTTTGGSSTTSTSTPPATDPTLSPDPTPTLAPDPNPGPGQRKGQK
jgi:hypothetical protein